MIAVLLGTGFEEIEAIAPVDILRRSGKEVKYVSVMDHLTVTGAHGINVAADMTLDQVDKADLEMVIIPGGLDGVNNVEANQSALELIKFALDNDRYVAPICAAPTILGKRGWIDGRNATCYPGMEGEMGGAVMHLDQEFVIDGKLITGRAPGAAVEFGLALCEAVTDESMKKTIMYFMVYGDVREI